MEDAMPAITALSVTALMPFGRALAAAMGRIGRGLRSFGRILKHRRDAGRLAGLDDRMLADIGITRSDLRDAYSAPLWQDPTDTLARRASERRRGRRRKVGAQPGHARSRTASAPLHYPPADRPARYLI
jgi:uncharacterized protein YjiS (DUF1127 family)